MMRTTLTLDPEVFEKLREKAASGKRPFKEIVNEALRQGLGIEAKKPRKPIRVTTFSSAFLPGVDPAKLNQIHDDLLVEDYLNQECSKK